MHKPLKVDCPTCKTKVEWTESSTHRPFCSKRCQMIDLGAWSNEEYTIPVENREEWSDQQTSSSDEHNNFLH